MFEEAACTSENLKKRKLGEEMADPKRIMGGHECCVCGVWRTYRMNLVPSDKQLIVQWSYIFGPKFLENCSSGNCNVNRFICSIHWEQIRDDWKGPLPEVLETMKRVHGGSFEHVMLLHGIKIGDSLRPKERKIYTCRYCGTMEVGRKMTNVPKNKKILEKWTEQLGQSFLHNVRTDRTNKICWSHFENRDLYSRSVDNLPTKSETTDEKVNIKGSVNVTEQNTPMFMIMKPKKCCVCGETNDKYRMTVAPRQKNILVKWSHVFGAKFFETCWRNKGSHYICSIHWKQLRDDWEGPLPEVLENMKKENNGSFEVVMFLNDIVEGNAQKPKIKSICRYCEVSCNRVDMTSVPSNEFHLMQWAEILGPKFLENVRNNKENKICWSHFKYRDSKMRSSNNLPMVDSKVKIEAIDEEIEVSNQKKVEEMENEQKLDLDILKQDMKTGEEENKQFDVLIPKPEIFTSILVDNETKPQIDIKNEQLF